MTIPSAISIDAASAVAPQLAADRGSADALSRVRRRQDSFAAKTTAANGAGQTSTVTHDSRARADDLDGHRSTDTHSTAAVNGTSHATRDTHRPAARAELLFAAEYLDDVERIRIATENRVRSMEQDGLDATPYIGQVVAFRRIEHEAELALKRVLRRHPLGPWIRVQQGIGEKQGARLLAAIGDVAWNHLEARPRRGPAELWAYCGYVPGQKRQKGVKSNWNAQAKMRSFLVAESCIKRMDSPYRATYDAARASWADRDVKDGHKHNHALRLTAKAILRDLFVEAKRVGA